MYIYIREGIGNALHCKHFTSSLLQISVFPQKFYND